MKQEIIDRLEWADGGDGVTYEYWFDPEAEKLYEVPMAIVREFDDSLLIDSKKEIVSHFKKQFAKL